MKKLTDQILFDVIKPRPNDSFKGTYGKVTLVGGNRNFGGAIIMASTAAVCSGAGLVTTATDPSNSGALHSQLPEAMFADFNNADQLASLVEPATTVVVGPGLGDDQTSLAILKNVFDHTNEKQNVIIDGSAITLMAREDLAQPKGNITYTPHQMEWQRLSGIKIAEQSEERNREAQAKLNATVVLKKHHTEIYTNDDVYQLTIGTPAQAVGGMGDTLAGMVGGFTAEFSKTPLKAVLAAVYAHSAVAEQIAKNQYIVLPHQISRSLPSFMKKMEGGQTEHQIGFLS
ncbi:NAD(P)H-hydrate dehydratase [Limosilactobacillus portuensis]|jgi:ADP-dependent NAD(P)H-hydrate dehydratase|uniref:ADP-dependent (S)-NAD(P)H-hydrate dehydratase n=1 Tax=Limosilactobacillus portuensis TaxID=2742601 RepID=A0ABS6IWN9_9LACO|nr:NAD(P)H-hydrate dehydratase [Limosilactobacillus portuensis]MBU9695718.1 NAD(P)H-hydrate dehydratase [Limosilactobacillus portuensis]MDU1505757.1 NAD(P)H-hydrate dehydratase [Limosilactobacillus vaginalis]PMC27188.1 NAD(P)H-hydrate dehydratase [Gardnerella vaginalis]WCT61241.1 NAD(P)H-hydrate dehydratase [Limosilactobacillus portuensis]